MFSSSRSKPGIPAGRGGPGLSFIAADVVVSGDVAASAQIHIDGRIDGNVRADALIQGEGGTITGNIIAESVQLAGLVDGTVRARLVTLEASARVTGDVIYETLSIAAGGAIEGRLSRKEGPVAEASAAAPAALPTAPPPAEESKRRPGKAKSAATPSLLADMDEPPAAANG